MSSAINEHTTVQTISQQISGDMPDGEVVILSLKDGVYFGLNSVGGRIWSLIQEPMSVVQIQSVILDEYDVDPAVCFQEIIRLLDELLKHGLISLQGEIICVG